MKKNLRLFLLYSSRSLQTILQGRVSIILFTLGKILRILSFLVIILLIFSKTNLVKGYTLNQMIIFYLTFNVIDTFTQLLFREVYRFRQLVISGDLDLVLLKPHHPFIRILIGGVDFVDLVLLIPFVGLLIYFVFFGGAVPDTASLLLYGLLVINSLLIATAFHIAVLALAILTTEVDHTILIYRDMTQLGRFPMDIYKEPIRGIFTFIIPVGIMMTFPPKALFHLLSWNIILISFLVSSLMLIASLKLWDTALKRYQSWGG